MMLDWLYQEEWAGLWVVRNNPQNLGGLKQCNLISGSRYVPIVTP